MKIPSAAQQATRGFDKAWNEYQQMPPAVQHNTARTVAADPAFAEQLRVKFQGLPPDISQALRMIAALPSLTPYRNQIIALCGHADPRIAAQAVRLVGRLEDPRLKELLEAAAHHSDGRVRSNAVESMEELHIAHRSQQVLAMLNSRHNRERATAIKQYVTALFLLAEPFVLFDGGGPLAVVAGIGHHPDLLRAMGDVQFLHGFDGVAADAAIAVMGGGLEEFLEAEVSGPADRGKGLGGDARIGVATEGDDLVAVGREARQGGDRAQDLGNVRREAPGESAGAARRMPGPRRKMRSVLCCTARGHLLVFVPGLVKTAGGLLGGGGDLHLRVFLGGGADRRGKPAHGHVGAVGRGRPRRVRAQSGAAAVQEQAGGKAGHAFARIADPHSRAESRRRPCQVSAMARHTEMRQAWDSGTRRGGFQQAGEPGEAFGGLEPGGFDQPQPRRPVALTYQAGPCTGPTGLAMLTPWAATAPGDRSRRKDSAAIASATSGCSTAARPAMAAGLRPEPRTRKTARASTSSAGTRRMMVAARVRSS